MVSLDDDDDDEEQLDEDLNELDELDPEHKIQLKKEIVFNEQVTKDELLLLSSGKNLQLSTENLESNYKETSPLGSSLDQDDEDEIWATNQVKDLKILPGRN